MFTIEPKTTTTEILERFNYEPLKTEHNLLEIAPQQIVPTYFMPEIDECLDGGFRSGTLNIITGAPSTGKSMFAMNIAYNMALNGKKVLLVSTEMTEENLLPRIYATALNRPETDFQHRNDRDNAANIAMAHEVLKPILENFKIIFVDNFDEIVVYLTEHTHLYDAIFIDHIHCLDMGGRKFFGNQQDLFVISELKKIWRNQKACLICVAQPNKQSPVWADMNNISGTGQWSQLASQIIYLAYTDDQKEHNDRREPGVPEIMTLVFAKQRIKGQHTKQFHVLRFYKWLSKVEYFRSMEYSEIKKQK